MKKAVVFSAIPGFLCFTFLTFCWALGLEVDPGIIRAKNAPLGKKIVAEEKLRIINKSAEAYTFTIDILPVSPQDPAASWIFPAEKEVRVEGNGVKEVELFVQVSNKRQYAGQKYKAIIEVENKKNNPGDLFIVAVQAQIEIETAALEKKKGFLGIF